MTSWCSFNLPCKAWVVLDKDGQMITTPMMHKASAERMAAENIRGTLKKALSQGYRVVSDRDARLQRIRSSNGRLLPTGPRYSAVGERAH